MLKNPNNTRSYHYIKLTAQKVIKSLMYVETSCARVFVPMVLKMIFRITLMPNFQLFGYGIIRITKIVLL